MTPTFRADPAPSALRSLLRGGVLAAIAALACGVCASRAGAEEVSVGAVAAAGATPDSVTDSTVRLGAVPVPPFPSRAFDDAILPGPWVVNE